MHTTLTTIGITLLTLLSLAASAIAIRDIGKPDDDGRRRRQRQNLIAIIAAGSAVLYLYRWLMLSGQLNPLEAHVDGLLLIATIFSGVLLYLQAPSRLPGISPFALPMLTFLLAWAICASDWTFHQFAIKADGLTQLWKVIHLAGVYLGTLAFAIATISGVMFLYVQKKLRQKADLAVMHQLASLENIERTIIRAAAIGFALLTLGLLTGLVILNTGPTRLGDGWWHSPKVLLATAVWLIYAVVMNVRHATLFRGARAAWLSILGMTLLLVVYGIVTSSSYSNPVESEVSPAQTIAPVGGEQP